VNIFVYIETTYPNNDFNNALLLKYSRQQFTLHLHCIFY